MTTVTTVKKSVSDGLPSDVGLTSQLSNSWRLKLMYGDDLRFVSGVGWIAWDGSRWAADEAKASQMCEKVTRELYAECSEAVSACSENLKRIKANSESTGTIIDAAKEALAIAEARHAFAKRSQSVASFRDMLTHAETFPQMRLLPDEIDVKPYLLSCKNGTLDLSTGTLRQSSREDYLTRQSPVAYDENADTSRWISFLMEALEYDEETIEYLRQFAGYSMCGEASQELFLFVHGPPGNGKSTLVEALCSCLGDELTITIDFETLCRKSTSSQKYDTARMRGIRIIRTSESDRQQRLDEGLVCKWVGGEKVRGRALYENPFDFTPQFALAMSVNGKPRINPDEQETGIWRRMVCVPFLRQTIPEAERDAGVKKFWTDPVGGVPAVLKWAASGARDYIKAGRLPPMPDRLKIARDRYREECDVVHRFMEDCMEPCDSDGFIPCEEFRSMFVKWSMDQGESFTLSAQQVTARITGAPWFCQKARKRLRGSGHVHVWTGIMRARSARDDESPPPESSRRTSVAALSDPILPGDTESDLAEEEAMREHGGG